MFAYNLDYDEGVILENEDVIWASRSNLNIDTYVRNTICMEYLRIVHLDDKAGQLASSLPYGQQCKLEIARALATNMKLLLLDEPAAGMNPTETAELLSCIHTIRDTFHVAILLIEHDMSLVMRVCERIQVINFGQTIAAGLPEEIASNQEVIEAYLGEEEADDDAED